MNRRVDPIFWRASVALLAGTLTAALLLIAALSLGWNSPRPSGMPDWEDSVVPRRLDAAAHTTELTLLNQTGKDFAFEIIARPISGPESGSYGYGLAYRAQDPSHYYAFAVGADGYYAVLRIDGSREILLAPWQQFPHIRRKGGNRLRVTCEGRSCTFAINDEYTATVEDDTWLKGDVGLWIRAFDEPVSVQYQSVRIWSSHR
ncbi:MAG: hypothetical protein PVH41_00045 [Anaerolineae bacterium]